MFQRGQLYTRPQIISRLGLPPTKGGPWFTGHHRHQGQHFIFCNIAIAGRTGHNYDNYFAGDRLVWHPRASTRLAQPRFAELISNAVPVHVFHRKQDKQPFVYAGVGKAVDVKAGPPIEVLWVFDEQERIAEEIPPSGKIIEGAKKRITVNAYERDSTAKPKCLAVWGHKCVVCGFDFQMVYGDHGAGFIHVHHLKPLYSIGEKYELDPVNDLRPVCPNCHAMLHRGGELISIDELRQLLKIRLGDVLERNE
jgi:5-methylcytosine-specific restriction protein A